MLLRAVGLVAAFLAPAAAQSQQVPTNVPWVDSEAQCRFEWAGNGSPNNKSYQFCLDQEWAARDELRVNWKRVSGVTRLTCERAWARADVASASYRMMLYCVRYHEGAAEQAVSPVLTMGPLR